MRLVSRRVRGIGPSLRSRETVTRNLSYAAFVIVTAVLTMGCAVLRWPVRNMASPNIEASYHMLLTVTALSESPVSAHHLLPTVSLGQSIDRNIPWGSTIPLASGHYVYTSFGPPGFIALYAFLKATGLPISLQSLTIFNQFLQIIACVTLFVFLVRLLRTAGITGPRAHAASLIATTIQMGSSEALLSYGTVYWSQQLYQIILIASLIALTAILERDAVDCRVAKFMLAIFAFLGPWTEWSGFVLDGVVVVALILRGRHDERYRRMAIIVGAAAALSLCVLIAHYALSAGLRPTLYAFAKRFLARTVKRSGPIDLVLGYWRSYGLFIPLCLAAAVLTWRHRSSGALFDRHSVAFTIFICALGALSENLVMMQHASQFSFDRLKFVVPAAILLAFTFASARHYALAIWGVMLAVALAQNAVSYRARIATFAAWTQMDRDNAALESRIATLTDIRCAVIVSEPVVRGYSNLLFHRGIYELKSQAEFLRFARTDRARRCGAIYLKGEMPFPDLIHYSEAIVMSKTGNKDTGPAWTNTWSILR